MPKKSESGKASKPGKARKEHSSKQGRAQKSGREERPGKSGGHGKKIQEKKINAGNQELAEGFKDLAGGKKSKDGCFPKLFMMALSFMAVGAYFFLRS